MTVNRREFAGIAAMGAGAFAAAPLLAQGTTGAGAGGGAPAGPGQEAAPAAGGGGGANVPLAPPDRQPPNLDVPRLQTKAGWAIVGLGEFALGQVMPSVGLCERTRITGLVSGHPDKAAQVAEVYGVDRRSIYNYANYDRIRANDGIDVVYIILPNAMHAEYTIRALEAGKHVLCEKPMAATAAECERMIAAARANGRKLAVAYRLMHEPVTTNARELLRARGLGAIRTMFLSNGQTTVAPNIRLSRDLAGGPVEDIGTYCINTAAFLTGEQPTRIYARQHKPADDPNFREVPASVMWVQEYASGLLVHCDCSFAAADSRVWRAVCADGYAHMDDAFGYQGQTLHVQREGEGEAPATLTRPKVQARNQFAAQMDAFSAVVLDGGETTTPGEMGLADMRVVEAIRRSIETDAPVDVG